MCLHIIPISIYMYIYVYMDVLTVLPARAPEALGSVGRWVGMRPIRKTNQNKK